ncbi:MAG: 50S ribosomal protein L11 methyltransferase [Myxococcota bacterium]
MDVDPFEDLWEHVRLLSDRSRNEQIIAMLARRAPGKVVAEIGCGTGLLSVVAARLGATKVYAIEPTLQWESAVELVQRNGLEHIVEVLPAKIEDLEPRPVDLAFSELLNAEPLAEEVCEAMQVAARWLTPDGRLAPRRLKIWAALMLEEETSGEVERARAALTAIQDRFDLNLGPLFSRLQGLEPYDYLRPNIRPCGPPVCIADLELGTEARPKDHDLTAFAFEDQHVGAAAIWFEAEYDDGIVLHNGPGTPGHWGHLVCAWPEPQRASATQGLSLRVSFEDDECRIEPTTAD